MSPIADFSGVAPLFPLPGATLFPHVVQPFHMFEPRYRQLAGDVVAGDKLIAIGILQPGHPELYTTKSAPIYETVCLGHVTDSEELADGRFNLVINGLSRATVVSEPSTPELYRKVELDLLSEHDDQVDQAEAERRRRSLIDRFETFHPQIAQHPAVRKTLESVLPVGVLCDFIAHVSDIDTEIAAQVLAELDIFERANLIENWLTGQNAGRPTDLPFPPKFSEN